MIRRIELVNFMSHARTVIEPAEGLTVLVGPNNCGKSAVVAALQILCQNDNSTYVMRHNERECSVTVETSDGHTVQWSRKSNSPRYVINGQVFDRLDRNSIPDELHDVLCLPRVSADGNREFDVHFGEQKSPVFLLDKPGSHAAQFFASSSDAASLVEMQKRHLQKMIEARKERIRLEADAQRLTRDLSILSAADQIGAQVHEAEAGHAVISRLSLDISRLTTDIDALEQSAGMLQRCEAEVAALAALSAPPALEATGPLDQLIDQLGLMTRSLEREAAMASALLSIQPAPDLADWQSLSRLIGDLHSFDRSCRSLDAECVEVRGLRAPPQLEEVQALRGVLRDLIAVGQQATAMQGRATALVALNAPPELASEAGLAEDILLMERGVIAVERAHSLCDRLADVVPVVELADPTALTQLVEAWEQAQRTIAAHEQSVALATDELQQAESVLRHWAQEHQICPTCGGPLDAARLAEHSRTHLGDPSRG